VSGQGTRTVLEAADLLSAAELACVREAVRRAEAGTSGEIRVHLDDAIMDDVLDHAAFVFEELGMQRTRDRNGVLIYVSVAQHRAAVIGDAGINAVLPHGYWNETLGLLLEHFRAGRHADGLVAAVERMGAQLQHHFPRRTDDRNELSDEVSIGR
jgi:uncharacterized membrane protein